VRAAQFSVVAFPKLDNEAQVQRLREKFDSWRYHVRPYVPMVLPFVPINLDEIQAVTEHLSRVRRNLHSFAMTFRRCIERGDSLLLEVEQGREQLLELHRAVHGGQPLLLDGIPESQPNLVLGRVTDARQRRTAMGEVNGIGRTLGVVDSLALLRTDPSDETRLVLVLPFGIGRVDYYDRFPG
jgi:hypothetical protein